MNRSLPLAFPRVALRTAVVAFLASTSALPAFAGWNATPESIANHPTWIYTPGSTQQPGGRRALLLVLHGCSQTHTQLKEHGNLDSAAEANAVVVAVPGVGSKVFGPGCWDYNGAQDGSRHVAELVRLARQLVARRTLAIDADQVFVTGLSSGGAMALDVACKAPDVFAGVGAVASPSVGSSQWRATLDGSTIAADNVATAVARCRSLAGPKASHFATQIANVAFGDMDRNGANARYSYWSGASSHSGQYQVVSTKWSAENVIVFRQLYGTGELGAKAVVQQGRASLQQATKDGDVRLSLLAVRDVGHAWPAGVGGANAAGKGGVWIAQAGLDYADFLVGWLTTNNPRRPLPIEVGAQASVSPANGHDIVLAGSVKPRDKGRITGIETELLKLDASGGYRVSDRHDGLQPAADGSYADRYAALADGHYKLQVKAMSTTAPDGVVRFTQELVVGRADDRPDCREVADSNYNHVHAGRAQLCGFAYVCALGSGDNLGLFNPLVRSTLTYSASAPGHFSKGTCPVVQHP